MERLFLAAALLCLPVTAVAHDKPTDWIGQERRTNDRNELCCGAGVDCHAILPTSVKFTPAGYQLPDGEVVPFAKAAPSADKFYWSCFWGRERKCFFAPMGAM